MCLYPLPSCHHAQFHCDLLISPFASHSACVGTLMPDWPEFTSWISWAQGGRNLGHIPNSAWHISHHILVLAASIVFNWSVGWLMSKPAVNLWPPHQGDSAFPSLSMSLALLVLTKHLFFVNSSPHCLPFFLFFCLGSSLPYRAPHHHIQSITFQTANFLLVNSCVSAKRCGVVKMFLWWSVVFCGLLP